MARSSCRDALVLLGIAALVAGTACTGKDPYRPGESIGIFHVTGALVASSCGATPDPWAFDVRLRHDVSTLYWVQGDAPISAIVDPAEHTTLKATASMSLRDATAQAAGCAMDRTDVVDLTLAPVSSPTTGLSLATSFTGTLTYHFAATDGSDCSDQLTAVGGDYAALPCDVSYTLTAAKTGDAN